ncbi:hypothetical protein HZH68_002574 [Vespula germanica]|uniref:Uncharacterized protein n=1 Tax=Vespula germanica TaxID=30212 RepID=A0A834NML5_VESGE|nr:hypothetical protein HZH68_002574 [Vespula germanica]
MAVVELLPGVSEGGGGGSTIKSTPKCFADNAIPWTKLLGVTAYIESRRGIQETPSRRIFEVPREKQAAEARMSDSEGSSVRSVLDSEKFEAEKSEEGSEPVPTWQNHPCDEKKGEFEKLLQSMMDSRESSQEEAEKEENEVDEKNTIEDAKKAIPEC